MIDDVELAKRSILGFGEMVAALGQSGIGPEAVIRRPNAVGARIEPAAENPWFDCVVVPPSETPPVDDETLPGCVWTVDEHVSGRMEVPEIATPSLGVSLDDPKVKPAAAGIAVEPAPLSVLAEINERAYGQFGVFAPLACSLKDDRIRVAGIRDGANFVCVALTITVGSDLAIHYVATEESHRRRGLATSLLSALLTSARDAGLTSATLQASPDGLGVYERIGFRQVATLRGFTRS